MVSSALNSSGGTKRTTGWCLRVGCRYWPMVRKSTPAERRSSITCSTSFRSSPRPTMMPDLVNMAAVDLLHLLQQPQRGEIARAGPHRQIERRHGFEIVVEHVGPRRAPRARSRRPCGGSPASGLRSWCPGSGRGSPRMVCAKCCAPPSARSSRSTEVTTTWARPSLAVASATWAGSFGSSAPGSPVLTLQKAQARVQVSPMIMKVACFLLPALADVGAAGLLADRVQAVLAHDVAGSRHSPWTPAP